MRDICESAAALRSVPFDVLPACLFSGPGADHQDEIDSVYRPDPDNLQL